MIVTLLIIIDLLLSSSRWCYGQLSTLISITWVTIRFSKRTSPYFLCFDRKTVTASNMLRSLDPHDMKNPVYGTLLTANIALCLSTVNITEDKHKRNFHFSPIYPHHTLSLCFKVFRHTTSRLNIKSVITVNRVY
jgi:hypothetical protein